MSKRTYQCLDNIKDNMDKELAKIDQEEQERRRERRLVRWEGGPVTAPQYATPQYASLPQQGMVMALPNIQNPAATVLPQGGMVTAPQYASPQYAGQGMVTAPQYATPQYASLPQQGMVMALPNAQNPAATVLPRRG
jgi:murein DD-endopeptidase MepM/ murein hydrolase activator NlpD